MKPFVPSGNPNPYHGTTSKLNSGWGHTISENPVLVGPIFVPNLALSNHHLDTVSNTIQAHHATVVTSNTNVPNVVATTHLSNAHRQIREGKEIDPFPTKTLTTPKLPTPINVDRLAYYLQGYNAAQTRTLLTGFSQGFKLEFAGKVRNSSYKNLKSAIELPDIIDSKLEKEITLGRIVGPFGAPPVDPLMTSPIGVVPKKKPGEYRMIQHLSYPAGISINDGIPREFTSVHYATVDDAIRLIRKTGRGCAMAKTDIQSAFRIIPVHPSDYNLLGFKWRNEWYIDRCLPMGCASSCKIFELFSTSLEWVARNKLNISGIIHILDDFLIVAQSLSVCKSQLVSFLTLCGEIGVPMSPEKTEGPSHILCFAGIELDCCKFEARLPREKIDKCLQAIETSIRKRKITLRDLQSLIGLLNFACTVIMPGRVFLRRLINLTIGVKRPYYKISLNNEVRRDLLVWKQFLDTYNGKTMFLQEAWLSSDVLKFYTDAAQSLGYGIIFNRKWAYGEWPDRWKNKNIAILELFPIVLGLALWHDELANKKILFYTDNESVVQVINNQTSKDQSLLSLVRFLVLTCLKHNILFRARHIRGRDNTLADRLSRLQVDMFRELAPDAEDCATLIPEDLLPQNWAIF